MYEITISVQIIVSFFFFKQKTAYEMRISDWSSDVCSSDLLRLSVMAGSPLFGRDRQFGGVRVVRLDCILGKESRQFAIGGIALSVAQLSIIESRRDRKSVV